VFVLANPPIARNAANETLTVVIYLDEQFLALGTALIHEGQGTTATPWWFASLRGTSMMLPLWVWFLLSLVGVVGFVWLIEHLRSSDTKDYRFSATTGKRRQ
jgi:hypothetical protein